MPGLRRWQAGNVVGRSEEGMDRVTGAPARCGARASHDHRLLCRCALAEDHKEARHRCGVCGHEWPAAEANA